MHVVESSMSRARGLLRRRLRTRFASRALRCTPLPNFPLRRKRKFDGKTLHTQTDPGTDAACVTVYDDTTIRRYDDRSSFFGEIGKIDHFLVNTRTLLISF
jgi:hypothetical protein